ncbi:MAG: FCSD flavin-binding domain-containing protein [Acidiferrobacterales bacterium]|nr:FCSD flavin-binding domain-containing protein [Acidiferrobacterales bacterium]
MSNYSRRDFIKLVGVAGATSAVGWPLIASGKKGGRVVIIGGGFGGASCAKYLRKMDKSVKVTLVEREANFVTCPFSNAVLGGLYKMDFITQSYDALRSKWGVKVIQDSAVSVDAAAHKVTLASGKTLKYDRLVVSPGVDIRWNALQGYDEAASQLVPHAWQAGPQTALLRKQLEAMKDGGVMVITAPANPYRCPPGPYERACMIAYYFKQNKPRSKILILDAKDKFAKQGLFVGGWNKLYPGMIEWVKGSDGGMIDRVDAKTKTVYPTFGDPVKADVLNVVPPQSAGIIALKAGLANKDGWCPIDQRTFESKMQKDIHVLGDASLAGKMPKSGFAASSQAKVCAAAIIESFRGTKMPDPSYVNTCYSLVSPDYGISVAAVYRLENGAITGVKGAGGVSPKDADADFRRKEARYAEGWYRSITADIFG